MIKPGMRTAGKYRKPNYWAGGQPPPVALANTWFFRLVSLAFISLVVPVLGLLLRGFVGFFLVMGLAVMAGQREDSLGLVKRAVREGVSENKWLVLFAVSRSCGRRYFRDVICLTSLPGGRFNRPELN